MANPQRGEVEIVVNGKPYCLRLTTEAACTLEARTGQKLGEVLVAAEALSMIALRDLVWVLLQGHHRDEFERMESVAPWIDEAGILSVVLAFRRLLEVNQPQAGSAAQAAAANPQTPPQSGTGGNSALRAVG